MYLYLFFSFSFVFHCLLPPDPTNSNWILNVYGAASQEPQLYSGANKTFHYHVYVVAVSSNVFVFSFPQFYSGVHKLFHCDLLLASSSVALTWSYNFHCPKLLQTIIIRYYYTSLFSNWGFSAYRYL